MNGNADRWNGNARTQVRLKNSFTGWNRWGKSSKNGFQVKPVDGKSGTFSKTVANGSGLTANTAQGRNEIWSHSASWEDQSNKTRVPTS